MGSAERALLCWALEWWEGKALRERDSDKKKLCDEKLCQKASSPEQVKGFI